MAKSSQQGLSLDIMQIWALLNETLRSIPFLGLIVACMILEKLVKWEYLSSEMATALKAMLAVQAAVGALGPVAGGATAAGSGLLLSGAAGAAGGAVAKGVSRTVSTIARTGSKAAPALASAGALIPAAAPYLLPAAGLAGVSYLSALAGKEAEKQLIDLDRQIAAGEISEAEARQRVVDIIGPRVDLSSI